MAADKNIIIIGGSYGGISIAHNLLKHTIPVLPEKQTFRVILLSSSTEVMCRPACPRALISDDFFPQDKLFVKISKLFEQYPHDSFQFIQSTVTEFNNTNRTITFESANGEASQLPFYTAVIATGATTHSPLMGYTRDEAHLRQTWSAFRKALPTVKHIVIAGGGPTAIETAGELGEYLNGRAGMFTAKLANPKVEITVVNSAAKILPQLRGAIAQTAEELLAKVGAIVLKGSAVQSVNPKSAGTTIEDIATPCTVTLANGNTLNADLYIPAYGTTPNTRFMPSDLLAKDGRVSTNAKTLRVDVAGAGARIYAIGDVASSARPAVHLTLAAVPVLAANIKRDLLLDSGAAEKAIPADREFTEDTRETQMVPVGKSKGVGAFMGYRMPSLFVWMLKGRDYWLWTTGNLWSGKQWAKEG